MTYQKVFVIVIQYLFVIVGVGGEKESTQIMRLNVTFDFHEGFP